MMRFIQALLVCLSFFFDSGQAFHLTCSPGKPQKDKRKGSSFVFQSDSKSLSAHGGGGHGGVATRPRLVRQILPISAALLIGGFSAFEVFETSRELTTRRWGHAHGIFVLAFVRLCRSIAILQTEVEEFEEGLARSGMEEKLETSRTVLAKIGRLLVSPVVTIIASTLAAFASMLEIFDDIKPGGHHGAALLALSELSYQVRRLQRFKKNPKRSPLARIVGMVIGLAAGIFAGTELLEDLRPGAHHAVAILAFAELVENINRSKILKVV